ADDREAAEAAREQQQAEREAPQPAPRAQRAPSRPAPKSGLEKVLASPTFWNQVIRTGSQVARTMWGTAQR
ncbi:MAG: hypothetical protein WAL91_10140, partial [Propionicimonas sp.]